MSKFMHMAGVGILMLGLGLSSAFALTEDEARTAVGEHAKASKWEEKYRSQAVNALNHLIEAGVPVDKAYEVVNACIDKGIRGADLAKVAKDIDARMDRGASTETAVKEAMSRIEQHATHDDARAQAKEDAKREQIRDTTQEHAREHGGGGAGAGTGAGGHDGAGAGVGGGAGTGR